MGIPSQLGVAGLSGSLRLPRPVGQWKGRMLDLGTGILGRFSLEKSMEVLFLWRFVLVFSLWDVLSWNWWSLKRSNVFFYICGHQRPPAPKCQRRAPRIFPFETCQRSVLEQSWYLHSFPRHSRKPILTSTPLALSCRREPDLQPF